MKSEITIGPSIEPDDEFAEVHDNPGHLIRRCHQIAVGIFMDTFGESGLTPVQCSILLVVKKRPGVDQTELSGLVALDRTNTATTLMRLEQKGLIIRRSCTSDRRIKRVHLTEAGEQLLATMPSFGQAGSQELLDELTPTERDLFIDLLKKIVKAKNACSRAPMQPRRRDARRSL
ncbi:MAG TPA: MarR family winged helix-turn-helix transcriptional regulator [Alphaproteobacteria bacterium]|nr:MarR family winged helix-turn-helix transcriptional regulator [Alphaproteobacteria bacterium]